MSNEQNALVSECFYENLRKIKKCFKLAIFRTLDCCMHVGTIYVLIIVPTEHMSSFLFLLPICRGVVGLYTCRLQVGAFG